MSVFDIFGNAVTPCDLNGNPCQAYDIHGNLLTGDYNIASSDYERSILTARDAWMGEARADSTVLPIVIHTDQHGRMTANNALFAYLSKAVPWVDASACIGLGDVCDYSESRFQAMENCLSGIPKEKQINIWGNHDTWTPDWYTDTAPPTAEELSVINQYFDNSAYNGNHKYNDKCVEYMIDEQRKIKYAGIGGWDYDLSFGGHSHYAIGSDTMDDIIQMLSAADGYDVVLLSHIQPFAANEIEDWTRPPVEEGGQTWKVSPLVNKAETTIDQMIIDRKNKASGTVMDSYGNAHSYDFTNCNSDLICCLSGHAHCDQYMWQDGDLPVCLFDAYYTDNHPIYFVNVDRTKRRLNVWKIDDSPMVYNYQIPFDAPA